MVADSPGAWHAFSSRVCPSCGSTYVHRSRRRMIERWMGWLHPDQRTYRCYQCKRRFWDNNKGPSRYVVSPSDLEVINPSAVSNQADPSGVSSTKQQRRQRGKIRGAPPAVRRFEMWLYHKYNMTIGMLVLCIILVCLLLIFFWWAMGQWE